eukprot:753404-Hanusia_phi.AAC.12
MPTTTRYERYESFMLVTRNGQRFCSRNREFGVDMTGVGRGGEGWDQTVRSVLSCLVSVEAEGEEENTDDNDDEEQDQ